MTRPPSRGRRRTATSYIRWSILVTRSWVPAGVSHTTKLRATGQITRQPGYLHCTHRITPFLVWLLTPGLWGLSAYGEWCRWELTWPREATGAPPTQFHERPRWSHSAPLPPTARTATAISVYRPSNVS